MPLIGSHFTAQNGLASNEAYYALQTSDGYLWISTDRGLCKYDGKEVLTYNANDGLGTNFVDKLWQSPNGILWVRCLDNLLYYYNKNKFCAFQYNKQLAQLFRNNTGYTINNITFANNQPIALSTARMGIIQCNTADVQLLNTNTPNNSCQWDKTYQCLNAQLNLTGTNIKVTILTSSNSTVVSANITTNQIKCLKRKNGTVLIAIDNVLVQIENEVVTTTKKYDATILTLMEDKDSCLWINTKKQEGVQRYKPNKGVIDNSYSTYFGNMLLSSVYQDVESGYWFVTHYDGVYYLPSLTVTTTTLPITVNNKEIIQKIYTTNDTTLYAITDVKKLWCYKTKNWLPPINIINNIANNGTTTTTQVNQTSLSTINYDATNYQLLLSTSYAVIYNTATNSFVNFGRITSANFEKIGANTYAILSENRLTLMHAQAPYTKKLYTVGSGNNYSVKTYNNLVYIGKEDGLYTIDTAKNTIAAVGNTKKNVRVTKLMVTNSNKLVASTLGNGLQVVNGNTSYNITLYNTAIPSLSKYNMVNDIVLKGDTLFAATQQGIVWCNINSATPQLYPINNIIGYNIINIKSISATENFLYILSQNDVIKIAFDMIFAGKPSNPIMQITSFVANEKTYSTDSTISLKSGQNNIVITTTIISLKAGKNLHYQYRLLSNNTDTTWRVTNNATQTFVGLPSGNYTYQVSTISNNHYDYNKVCSLSFTIKAPFYQSAVFLVGCFACLLFLMFIINQRKVNRINKQNVMNEKLLRYEQDALASQINPHFIFNSLNSIQSYVLTNDKENTLKYITKFSRLMRLSLNHSRAKWVTPTDEMDLIKLYFELELLRQNIPFTYELITDERLIINKYLMPAMLTQPFIENAIKHGISNLKDKAGHITVSATLILPQKHVMMRVEDNGIGRQAAALLKSKTIENHISTGVDISITRLQLLCKESHCVYYYNVMDKPNGTGTIIEYYLPHIRNPLYKTT